MGFEIGKTVSGYEIVEVLGSSKAGVAYKVRNVFSQRFEILKILPKDVHGDEERIARFLREIKVHARLVHPNIVTFYNAREIEGQLVMTTEFVPGMTVAERLESGAIAWRDAIRYACQALSALEYAHANGIIHRGLTASSLVITAEGIVRLSGFGMAKAVSDPTLTVAGTVVGALRYISPEQVKGLPLDARCDIYSLGVVLYEMLTGKLPFASKGQFDVMLAHVNTPPRHPSDVTPEVPRELGDIVMKALAKEADQRFQTAQEFRGTLERAAGEHSGSPAAAAASAADLPMAPSATSIETPQGPFGHEVPSGAWLQNAATGVESPAPPSRMPPAWQAMFGNSFLSKLTITLAVCVITFLIGSVALFALMAVSGR